MNRMELLALERNDPLAKAVLGLMCFNGIFGKDVKKSKHLGTEVVSWLRLQSDKNAYYCLGQFYFSGLSVEVDKEEAARYWKLGAEEGCELCLTGLGLITSDDSERFELFRKGAEAGFCVAQHNLAWCCDKGPGDSRDPCEAVRLYRLAADQGYRVSQCDLGLRYYDRSRFANDGIDGVDFIEAVRWLRLSADQGHAMAQHVMGVCCKLGRGTPIDDVEMIKWFRLAVAQDFRAAQFELGLCYEVGRGVPKDFREAVRRIAHSSEQGYEPAKHYLAKGRLRNSFAQFD